MKSMLRLLAYFTIFLAASFRHASRGATAADLAPPKGDPRLGINLAGPCDWNTELPFVDVFRMSRRWISQREGAAWGKGPKLTLDEHGWVKSLEPGCYAETLMCTIEGGHYPRGEYSVFYDGKGRLEFKGSARVIASAPGRMLLDVDPGKGAMFLRLMETDPSDPVRNIRVIMPGFEEKYERDPWRPGFLERWRGVAAVRFMDFMHTNNSKVKTWAERPKMTDATWSGGVPLEILCDLANRLRADPWFCMPHMADDDYVRRFATMTKELLDPGRKAYVEYSNEVWNGIFEQHRYAAEEGQKRGFAEKPWEAAWRYTAFRSVEMFRIWDSVFGNEARSRLVRVLSTQSVNPYISEQILGFQDAYKRADVLGIAPYIGMNVPKDEADAVVKSGLVAVLKRAGGECLDRAIESMKAQKAVADEYGLKLACYEAGQHLVGVGGAENNEELTALLQEANQSSEMGRIYERYFAAWEATGGDLLCHFSSISRWSKWGSWGLMQYYDDPPVTYPKYEATMRWGRRMRGK